MVGKRNKMENDIILIAEIGINANGSLDIAKKLIDVAKDAGCHYVKFQKRDVENGGCYTKDELAAPRESPWGKTNRDQKLGLEFNVDQYKVIDAYCKQRGIGWFVSCWDEPSLELMEANFPDMPFNKVASALLTNEPFLRRLKASGRPVILSTGMSTEPQWQRALDILDDSVAAIFHCTSTYPCKPEEMNLSYVAKMCRERDLSSRDYQVGFSNHYSGISWAPLAVTLGATMLEFHITLDRTMYGSDQSSSIEPEGIKKLASLVGVARKMLGDGKKVVYASEVPIAKKLRKRQDF